MDWNLVKTLDYPLRLELREDGRTLSGMTVPYEQTTHGVPHPGGERFAKRAFKRSLDHMATSGRKLKLFRSHNHDYQVGVGLEVTDAAEGVLGEFRIADTPHGNEALLEVREGVLDSMSVGFRAIREQIVDGVRVIYEAALLEVSLVAFPAYEGARITGLRNVDPSRIEIPPAPFVDMAPFYFNGRSW